MTTDRRRGALPPRLEQEIVEPAGLDRGEPDDQPRLGHVVRGEVEDLGRHLEQRVALVEVDVDDDLVVVEDAREQVLPHVEAGGPVARLLDRLGEPERDRPDLGDRRHRAGA